MRNYRRIGGSLTVITGSMFSGKTEELIRLIRRAMHARRTVQVFKSALETRCGTAVIRTHDGNHFEALAIPHSTAMESLLLPDAEVVGIEEVQFFDEGIVPLCESMANRKIDVIAAGLDQDFRGEPFGFMPRLLALADHVEKLHAICMRCGAEASRTQRLIDGRPAAWDDPIILIGASESYEARCRACHEVRRRPAAKRRKQVAKSHTFRPSHSTQNAFDSHPELFQVDAADWID